MYCWWRSRCGRARALTGEGPHNAPANTPTKDRPLIVIRTLARYPWTSRLLQGAHMKPEDRYAALVAQAERAVASVKDPSLKQIAFQKVLDNLLGANEPERPSPSRPAATRKSLKPRKIRGSARGGPTQYIQELIGDNFFRKLKTISEVKAELGNRGNHIALTSLSGPLQNLVQGKSTETPETQGFGQETDFRVFNLVVT